MEEVFRYYASNPMAGNAEAAAALGIDETKLRVYKSRLKKRGYIAVTDEHGVIILKKYGTKEAEKDEIFDFKQDTYRQLIDKLMACMDKSLSVSQTTEISREIRTILKEVV